jgi:hypothetical protein
MKFQVIHRPASGTAQSPVRIIEQSTGHEIGWVNRDLDREYVRRLSEKTLQAYAYDLLHFVRWWAGIHHTGDIQKGDLSEATLLEYVRFQSGLEPLPSGTTINSRVGARLHFPDVDTQPHHAVVRRVRSRPFPHTRRAVSPPTGGREPLFAKTARAVSRAEGEATPSP